MTVAGAFAGYTSGFGSPSLSLLENALCGRHWYSGNAGEYKFDGLALRSLRETLWKLPTRFRKKVEGQALTKYEHGGHAEALAYVAKVSADLAGGYVSLAASDAEIVSVAKDLAEQCQGFIADHTQGLEFCKRLAQRVGVEAPDVKAVGVPGAAARLCDALWWRRSIRKHIARKVEQHAIELGFVHSRAGKYASNESLDRRMQQKARNEKTLQGITATNECGQSYTLAELAALSVANPRIRRAELMMRIAGFESIARASGHVGEFYTITCPSKYHARLSKTGLPNPRFKGLTPREGQIYLVNVWRKVRAQLAKKGIKLYGFRVAEPQHDGTPHWHVLVFMPPEQVHTVRKVISGQACKEDAHELGSDQARRARFLAKSIDWERGSAAGYIAKYIAKNVDGAGLDSDIDGEPLDDAARRVDAWASTWGIRQFQQQGGAPVTVWREARRIELGANAGTVAQVIAAADKADWHKYIELQGGATAARKDHAVSLFKVWSDNRTRYGGERGDIVKGVQDAVNQVVTRLHTWVSRFSGLASPWSPVNNCNQIFNVNEVNGKREHIGRKSRSERGGKGGKSGESDGNAAKNWGFDRCPIGQT